MKLTLGLLFCLLSIGQLHGAAINNVEFIGYDYEKPQIPQVLDEFQTPQEQYKPPTPHEQNVPLIFHVQYRPPTPPIAGAIETVEPANYYPDIDLRGNLVDFQFPSPLFKTTEEELNFNHQEVASKTEKRRRGPVKLIKFKGVLDNFNYTTYVDSVPLCRIEVVLPKVIPTFEYTFKGDQRPADRRLAPYTETEVDAAYFQQ